MRRILKTRCDIDNRGIIEGLLLHFWQYLGAINSARLSIPHRIHIHYIVVIWHCGHDRGGIFYTRAIATVAIADCVVGGIVAEHEGRASD
jgi:hypothetical protein|tara:strand:- start:1807 stop:2076 length:270 start_codon:yes stop_codon:yes gene_type:complete